MTTQERHRHEQAVRDAPQLHDRVAAALVRAGLRLSHRERHQWAPASSGRAPSHRSDGRHKTDDDDGQDHQDDQQRGESGQSSAGCERQQRQSHLRSRCWLKGVKVASEPFLEKAAHVFKLVIATTITHQKIRTRPESGVGVRRP